MSLFGSQQLADAMRPEEKQTVLLPSFLQGPAIKKAENLFKRSNRLLMVPLSSTSDLGRSTISLLVMDRSEWKSEDYFLIPLPIAYAQYLTVKRGGMSESICSHLEVGTRNWDISIAFAHMLTLCGYDIYLYSMEEKATLVKQVSQGHIYDFRSDIFNPSTPPEVLFVMNEEQFKSTFGFSI